MGDTAADDVTSHGVCVNSSETIRHTSWARAVPTDPGPAFSLWEEEVPEKQRQETGCPTWEGSRAETGVR